MNLRQIVTFIKEHPEKIIFWLLLATFVFLGSYLALTWSRGTTSFSLGEITVAGGKPVTEAAISVDFGDLLTRKPITYYNDFVQRNPFAKLPRVVGPGGVGNLIDKRKEGLIYFGMMRTPEGLVAFIKGKEPYWPKEGDVIEGWKLIKIEEDKVKLYNEEEGKDLILSIGGEPEVREEEKGYGTGEEESRAGLPPGDE